MCEDFPELFETVGKLINQTQLTAEDLQLFDNAITVLSERWKLQRSQTIHRLYQLMLRQEGKPQREDASD